MTFEEELIGILNQIPGAIEKAFTAFVERHPGHGSQKPHGRRYGAGGEVLPKGHKRGDAVKGGSKAASDRKKTQSAPKSQEKRSYSRATDSEMQSHYKQYNQGCVSKGSKDCIALNKYAENSDEMNHHLRFGKKASPEAKKYISDIDKAMEDGPRVPKDAVVHRQVSSEFLNSGAFEQGGEFSDKGYISTTIMKGAIGNENIEIRIPKGSKGLYLEGLTDWEGEQELLLPRDSKFRVIEKTGNRAVLELIQ